MKRLALLAVIFLMAGCANRNAAPLPAPETAAPTQAIPTLTSIPPSPTPVKISVQVTVELANCRFGPATVYVSLNEIRSGRNLVAIGRNETANWWLVEDPINPGGFCWLSADVTDEQGDVSLLPIVSAPFVSITKAVLRVEPNRIVVRCSDFPQTVFFEAAITANGPTLFTWQWEASTGALSDVGTLIFDEAGTQLINEFYQINSPNEYWVKLKILTPNEMVEQVTFPVSCNP
ncbi:hypothetical protein MASR2M66_05130 [Chloroflexota bacterium]